MSRFLTLYLRSRRTPAALAGILAATLGWWAMGLAVNDPSGHLVIASLAAAIGAALLAPSLAGADIDLERTAALRWPRWRAAHVIAGAAVLTAVLAVTLLTGDPIAPALVLLRDAAGLVGLVALTAALFGTSGAWVPPLAWSAVGLMAGPLGGSWLKEAGTWLVQPAGNSPAMAAAAVLALSGLAGYAANGVRGS
jgi:hypothetical protein